MKMEGSYLQDCELRVSKAHQFVSNTKDKDLLY